MGVVGRLLHIDKNATEDDIRQIALGHSTCLLACTMGPQEVV